MAFSTEPLNYRVLGRRYSDRFGLALGWVAMILLPAIVVTGTVGAAAVFAFVLDVLKLPILVQLEIVWRDWSPKGW